jgi:ligand-binding sensor domain-containing protein
MPLVPYTREAGTGPIAAANGQDLIYFMSITEDNDHNLWMLTYGEGIYRYDGKSITHFPVKDGDIDVTLFSIYKDRQGDLWVGTHQVGPYKFNGKSFEKFKP